MNDVAGMAEGSHYAWDPRHKPFARGIEPAHHRLTVFARSPSQTERAAFRAAARWTFALAVQGPAVVLLWRAAGWPWSDAPFAWQLQDLPPGTVPDVGDPGPDGAKVPIDCLLVDAATGQTVGAVRHAVPWDPLVRELHRAIAAQAAAPWDRGAYDAALASLPSSEDLVRAAIAQAEAGGGR